MKKDLGLETDFPVELGLNFNPKLPVPALGAADKPRTFAFSKLEIFVTPTDSFKMKFRDVFTDTKLTHHMNYWPQQLNFAVWCATTGCRIGSRIIFEDKMKDGIHDVTVHKLHLPKQVRGFIWFHVYFTIRQILHELGGIQSSVTLPCDDAFDQNNNTFDVPSYKRLCNECGISSSTDFRFHQGMNFGLGNVCIYYSNYGYGKTEATYPGNYKLSDEGGKANDGNLIQTLQMRHLKINMNIL